ncbi:NfeD family protein [Paractinoplanes globisporus]|uniref:NfeD family protein n=1 Tax=Paractinoplanes globisporus TaxID=113565 RepID=A0ABW6WLC2_9ACTN|nr:NfeD family protein [Actinoplanes globisporus]
MASQTLVGRVGTVITAIRGGERAGEVRLLVDGIAHYYLAYAAEPLPTGTEVLVINNRGARQIDVEPWPTVPPGSSAPPDGIARGFFEEGL